VLVNLTAMGMEKLILEPTLVKVMRVGHLYVPLTNNLHWSALCQKGSVVARAENREFTKMFSNISIG